MLRFRFSTGPSFFNGIGMADYTVSRMFAHMRGMCLSKVPNGIVRSPARNMAGSLIVRGSLPVMPVLILVHVMISLIFLSKRRGDFFGPVWGNRMTLSRRS